MLKKCHKRAVSTNKPFDMSFTPHSIRREVSCDKLGILQNVEWIELSEMAYAQSEEE